VQSWFVVPRQRKKKEKGLSLYLDAHSGIVVPSFYPKFLWKKGRAMKSFLEYLKFHIQSML
jgi:hypothetical protein